MFRRIRILYTIVLLGVRSFIGWLIERTLDDKIIVSHVDARLNEVDSFVRNVIGRFPTHAKVRSDRREWWAFFFKINFWIWWTCVGSIILFVGTIIILPRIVDIHITAVSPMGIDELIALIALLLTFIGAVHFLLYEMLRDKITKHVQETVTRLAREEREISIAETIVNLSLSSGESYRVMHKTEELCKDCRKGNAELCELHKSVGSAMLLERTIRFCKIAYLMVQKLQIKNATGRVILNASNNYLYWLSELQEKNLKDKKPDDPFVKTLALELRRNLLDEISASRALQYTAVTERDLISFQETCLRAGSIFLDGEDRDVIVGAYEGFKKRHDGDESLRFWGATPN